MALRVRPTRSQTEFEQAMGAIGHYFGGWSSEDAVRLARIMPPERTHAAFEGGAIVGGAGVFPFELSVPGGSVPCAGVSIVGVLPTHPRRGILDRMMRAQLAEMRERGEPLAALWASDEAIYGRFGYGLATQDVMIRAPRAHAALHAGLPNRAGTTRLVAHDEAARLLPTIYERARRSTPGFISRSNDWWELRTLDDRPERRRGAGELNRVVLELDGRPAAYALYRIRAGFEGATNTSRVLVSEAIGDSPVATREIWRYLLSIDWVQEIHCELLCADHPLFLLVAHPNRLDWKVFDGLWLRLVDVGAALSARATAADGRVTLELTGDAQLPDNVGRWTVADGGSTRSTRRADLRLDVQALASAYLGGFTFAELARAGRVVEERRGGIAAADALFRVDRKPWCPEIF